MSTASERGVTIQGQCGDLWRVHDTEMMFIRHEGESVVVESLNDAGKTTLKVTALPDGRTLVDSRSEQFPDLINFLIYSGDTFQHATIVIISKDEHGDEVAAGFSLSADGVISKFLLNTTQNIHLEDSSIVEFDPPLPDWGMIMTAANSGKQLLCVHPKGVSFLIGPDEEHLVNINFHVAAQDVKHAAQFLRMENFEIGEAEGLLSHLEFIYEYLFDTQAIVS